MHPITSASGTLASRTLFGGDLAVKGTTVWIPTNLQGDLTDYLASLERVLALAPARILPAHGATIDDPDALLRGYLAHRHEREEQVIAALRAGDCEPEAIVEQHLSRPEGAADADGAGERDGAPAEARTRGARRVATATRGI